MSDDEISPPSPDGTLFDGNTCEHVRRPSLDELRGGDPLEAIGAVLGVSRERVRQIEEVALEKVRIAVELEELLGARAYPALIALRGRKLSTFRAALARARGEGDW